MDRKGRNRAIVVLLLLVAVSFAVLLHLPGSTEAMGSPTIRITLEASSKSVDVSPGSTGIVTFNGTVYAEAPVMPPGQSLVVNLQADAGGWPVSVPPSMAFTNNHTQEDFSISVQVPIETSTRTQGQLSISGRWSYSPGTLGGTVDPATAIVLVKQFYDHSVSPAEAVFRIGEDSISGVVFNVHNKGNGADRIVLEVTNEEELELDGIMVSVDEENIAVPEKQTRDYPITVVTAPSTPEGKYRIDVRVHSVQAESSGAGFEYKTSSAFIEVIEGYVPDEGKEEDGPVDNSDGPLDEEDMPDDGDLNITFDHGDLEDLEDMRSSGADTIVNVGLVIGGLLFLLILVLVYRKVRRS